MNLTALFEQTVAYRHELMNAERFPENNTDLSYFLTTGVVYLFHGECFGWSQYLKEPHEYCPNVIAVSVDGDCFQAVGGDDRDGAIEWLPIEQ